MKQRFVRDQSMDAQDEADADVSRIALAIGEPARTRMLLSLLDGRARTSTELAVAAGVAPSTASIHLSRLRDDKLVSVVAEGRHRYYALESRAVASTLERLSVLAGRKGHHFRSSTPERLRVARTCYDHMAGTLAVELHDHLLAKQWLRRAGHAKGDGYDLSAKGEDTLKRLGVRVQEAAASRRKFAFACLDWSERRPHLAGSLASAILELFVKKKWIVRDMEGRGLVLTATGKRGLNDELAFVLPGTN